MAGATALGAWLALSAPWPASPLVLAVIIACGWWQARPVIVVVGCFGLATVLSAHAWAGAAPARSAPFAGVVTLLTDPRPLGPGVVAEAVSGDRHMELRAFGGSARRLRTRRAGEQLDVTGRSSPPSGRHAGRLRARHIVSVVDVTRVSFVGDGTALARSANRARRLLEHGARTMDPIDRSLYLGFVVGDDRGQPRELVDAFRASGLAHLSAVSGQNVAFLLAVAAPGLRRLQHRARWAATLGLIGWFAVLTRFEPSVLRASVMAALGATALVSGRPAGAVRALGLTVTIVLLLDPLLIHSVGWWLSVAATAGIAVLGPPLAARLPGPAAVRAALSVTLAAQLGVAPVSIAVFGPLPMASIPANLLAGPAAGPVMVYGLPAGLLAAVSPDPIATALQVPTVALVRFIAFVAVSASSWPLPRVGAPGLMVVTALLVVVLRRPRRHRR